MTILLSWPKKLGFLRFAAHLLRVCAAMLENQAFSAQDSELSTDPRLIMKITVFYKKWTLAETERYIGFAKT